jgi:hypothetical protein
MKNMKVFIVTYKRKDVLNETLHRLFNETDFSLIPNTEVFIINNHSDFYLNPEFEDKQYDTPRLGFGKPSEKLERMSFTWI